MSDSDVIPILGAGLALRWALAGAPVILGAALGRAQRRSGGEDPRGGAGRRGRWDGERRGRGGGDRLPHRPLPGPVGEPPKPARSAAARADLVDATVPLAAAVSGKPTRSLGVWQGSAAQQAQEMVPDDITVVAALHTVGAPTLTDLHHELDEDVLVCGDKKADKARVARLIELIPGLRAVNAGPLEMARIVEQLMPMLISVNSRYKAHAGIKPTGLPDADHGG